MLKKAVRQYKYYLISAAKTDTKRGKILIFGQGRTRSTLLTDLLSKHDDVFCHEEIFGNHHIGPVLFPARLADGMAKSVDSSVYGFHAKPGQLRDNTTIDDISEWLSQMERQGWYIVHLWRRNLLKHAISTLKASKTEVYHSRDGNAPTNMAFDPEELMDCMVGRGEELERERSALRQVQHVEVVYEDNLVGKKAQQATCNAIFRDLGIEVQDVNASLEKVTPDRLTKVIRNYNVIEDRLRGTAYGKYLEAEHSGNTS